MQVLSVGSLRAGSVVWQRRGGGFVLTIVCKATYWLQPGEALLNSEQEAINEVDDHWDDDPNRSVRAPNDLVPVKPRPEVMLVGHAFAPNQSPVRSLVARLVVGEMDKAIEVHCDRTFLPDGSLQEGPRFTRMRLSWERAGGGPGTNNPVGVRPDHRDAYGRRPLPNLQPLGSYVSTPDDFIPPVGFGPIAASWPSRADLVGHAPPPAGAGLEGPSEAYFNAAPADQLVSALRENERIVLENLHPEHARLVTSLPGIRPAVFVDRGQGPAMRVAARADALWIDTDRSIATMTWRAQVPLARPDEQGRVVVGAEPPGLEMTWAEVVKALLLQESGGFGGDEHTMTNVISTADTEAARRRALPFESTPPPPAPRESLPSIPASGDLPFQSSAPQQPASPPSAQQPPWPAMQSSPRPPSMKPPPVPGTVVSPAARAPLPGTVVAPASVRPPPPAIRPSPNAPEPPRAHSPWSLARRGPNEEPEPPGSKWSGASAEAPSTDSAAEGGALGASNEAAGVRPWTPPRREMRSTVALDEEAQRPTISRELLHLVWFEPSLVPRIRRVPSWKKLLADLAERGADKEIDDALAGKEAWEIEDRREVFEILARGDRTDEPGLSELCDGAIREDGKYAMPVVLVGGEIEAPFDEMETLKAISTAAAAIVGPADEGLAAAIEAADKLVARGGTSISPTLPEGLSTRIREAFIREKKSLPADALDVQAERALLAGRHYQRREVLGGTFIRLLLRLTTDGQPLVVYAPEVVAKKLPMYRRFRARLIAELHPSQDQYEARGEALRTLALGTITATERRRAPAD